MGKFGVVLISVVSTGVLLSVAGRFVGSSEKAVNPTAVSIENPQREDFVEVVSAPGVIEPKTRVSISARVSARIVELPYKMGDVVTSGNPQADPPVPPSTLVRLDDTDLRSQLRLAQASMAAQQAQLLVEKAGIQSQQAGLEAMRASLEQAQLNLRRNEQLLASNDISQAVYDDSRFRFAQLQAECQAAQSRIESAQLNLDVLRHNLDAAQARIESAREALTYTEITSPIDGVVTRINAQPGEVVVYGTMNNPGTVIIQVADLSRMLAVAEVDETALGMIEIGQEALVRIHAFAEDEFIGKVETIALTHDISSSGARYYKTEVLLEPCDRLLYSGLNADIEVLANTRQDSLTVPSQAVLARRTDSLPAEIADDNPDIDPNKTFATVVFRKVDGKAVVTPVIIGPGNITHTVIESGLTDSDQVIVGPYKILDSLTHNQLVRDQHASADQNDENSENAQ